MIRAAPILKPGNLLESDSWTWVLGFEIAAIIAAHAHNGLLRVDQMLTLRPVRERFTESVEHRLSAPGAALLRY